MQIFTALSALFKLHVSIKQGDVFKSVLHISSLHSLLTATKVNTGMFSDDTATLVSLENSVLVSSHLHEHLKIL